MSSNAKVSLVIMDKGKLRAFKKEQRHRGVLYRMVRHLSGLTQREMASEIGCTVDALVRREVIARKYSVIEYVELQRISGLNDVEWCELLREIAK